MARRWLRLRLQRFGLDPSLLREMPEEDVRSLLAKQEEEGRGAAAELKRRIERQIHERQIDGRDAEPPGDAALPRAERPPKQGRRAVYARRMMAAAATVVLVAGAALWGVHRWTQPPTARLASLDAYDARLEQIADIASSPVQTKTPAPSAALREGAAALERATSTTLGLFTRYDRQRATEATAMLERAYAEMQSASGAPAGPAAAEAAERRSFTALLIAKGHLMRGAPTEARRWLERAAAPGSPWRADARALIERLDALST